MFTSFSGTDDLGAWQILTTSPVKGEGLASAKMLSISHCPSMSEFAGSGWQLTGVASNVRYVERTERAALVAVQASLGRPDAVLAALIPIKKVGVWWDLPQDERRKIFEDKSRHISQSLKYLPAVARQLYHSRDLGEAFDFLTWFEYAPAHAQIFEELVQSLRETEEWTYVEREVDVRLSRQFRFG